LDGFFCKKERQVGDYNLLEYTNLFKEKVRVCFMEEHTDWREAMYFGHPVNTYNTPLETELMETLQLAFKEKHIENPNQLKHQEGYKRVGMNYYFDEVLPTMAAGVFLSFPDGKFGAGVFGEAERMVSLSRGIWTVTYDRVIKSVKDIEVLRSRALTVEETRQRIYIGGKRENGMKGFFD